MSDKRVGIPRLELLTAGDGNPKTAKAPDGGSAIVNAVLHLAPASLSGRNVCQYATPGCIAGCLNLAGRGGIPDHGLAPGYLNRIQRARVRRTNLYFDDRETFWRLLRRDLDKLRHAADLIGARVAVRLNGTSDIPWHRIRTDAGRTIMSEYHDVTFYDYTKRPFDPLTIPPNYSLTFSYAGPENRRAAVAMLRRGVNVAVVFDTPKGRDMPHELVGVPVIDGDAHDFRFLDPVSAIRGYIVGLRAKGPARKDASGFVVRVAS